MNNKLHHDTVNWVAVELQTTGEWFRVNFQYHGAIYHQWEDRCIKDWRQFVFTITWPQNGQMLVTNKGYDAETCRKQRYVNFIQNDAINLCQ